MHLRRVNLLSADFIDDNFLLVNILSGRLHIGLPLNISIASSVLYIDAHVKRVAHFVF
jgi:hypothetical protein